MCSLAGVLLAILAPLLARSESVSAPESRGSPVALVAAASDLQFALDEIVARFERDTGLDVRVTYGSSGNFARQIEQGAPFEIFLSADEAYALTLAGRGLARGRGDLYALGRIVLFVPHGSALRPDANLEHFAARLANGTSGRLAIANPEHAPYGRAAEQALRTRGLWTAVRPRLVLGENVSQAAQFASGGDTEGGLIAYSLALSPELRQRGTYALIPDSMHAPLRQRMVLLQRATPAAERFYEYLRSPPSREILARYGFVLPAE